MVVRLAKVAMVVTTHISAWREVLTNLLQIVRSQARRKASAFSRSTLPVRLDRYRSRDESVAVLIDL